MHLASLENYIIRETIRVGMRKTGIKQERQKTDESEMVRKGRK